MGEQAPNPEREKAEIFGYMCKLVMDSRQVESPEDFINGARLTLSQLGLMREDNFDALFYRAEDVVNAKLYETKQIIEGAVHDQAD